MAWEPNFRMSQVNTGPAVSDILNRGIGGFLDKRVQQLTSEEDKKQQQANLDRAYALQVSADKRAEEQAQRAQQDQERRLLGEQRLSEFANRLAGGLSRGEMSDVQASKVNADINNMLASGMTPEQVNKKLLSKEYAPNLALKAPQTTADKLAYVKSAGFDSPDYDASKLLNYQQQLAQPLEHQLQNESNQAANLKLEGIRQTGENSRLAQRLSVEKALQAARLDAEKQYRDKLANEKPTMLYKTDAQGNIIYTQARNDAELKALTQQGGWSLGGNIDRAPARKDTTVPLFGASKEATGLNLDLWGTGDTDTARMVGQRLQNTYKLKPEEVGNILTQATGGIIDRSIDPEKLATALLNSGAAKTQTGAINAAKTLLTQPAK